MISPTKHMALNIALRTAMWERNLSQSEVARRAGWHESKLSKIAHGWRDATDDEKKTLAKILRKTVDQLFPPVGASA